MFLFRRLAFLLAVTLACTNLVLAQDRGPRGVADSGWSSSLVDPTQDGGQAQAPATNPSTSQNPAQNQGTVSVQARIRARRETRRAQAIRDIYTHLYETYAGMSYLRFTPGPALQHVTFYAWDTEVTRYYNERLGITLDGRGYYGTAFVGLNPSNITRPAISTYAAMGGPTYRFYIQPRYSISARVMGGYMEGNFSGDTNGFGSIPNPSGSGTLLWKDSGTYAFSGGLIGELNVTPALALRLGGEYLGTGFGSSLQNNPGFTGGFVFRFGRQ